VSEIMSFRRLGLLLRNDAADRYRALLMHSAVLAAVILIVSLMQAGFGDVSRADGRFYFFVFLALLFVWGNIVASVAFKELHDKTKNDAYLLLPASDVEKTIARLLPATVGFFVYLVIYMTVVSWIAESANLALFGVRNGTFNVFDANLQNYIGHYIVGQSIYFLGAAWFRKAHFWKTALTVVIFFFVFPWYCWLIFRLLFPGYFDGFVPLFDDVDLYDAYQANETFFDGLAAGAKFAYYFVLPPLCWVVAWLRVKETQVSHGV
jgi:hypothetical protein